MLSVYPACFYEENDGRYSVIFPDLNHLATFGDDLCDAMNMAVECLASYLFELKMSKENAPQPSDMNSIDVNAEYDEYKKAFVNMVSVDVEEYAKKHFKKSVKKTLTIPMWMNIYVVENNLNCSAILQKEIKNIMKNNKDIILTEKTQIPFKHGSIPKVSKQIQRRLERKISHRRKNAEEDTNKAIKTYKTENS